MSYTKLPHIFLSLLIFTGYIYASPVFSSTLKLTIPKLQVVTEHLPPLQYAQNNIAVSGFSTEVVKLLLIELKQPTKITAINWARAYQMAITQQNVLIFSMTRSPEREALFHWVGPVVHFDNFLWRLSSRNELAITNLEQAKQHRISVPRNDSRHQYLAAHGFKDNQHLLVAANFNNAAELLLRGRVAYFAGAKLFLLEKLKQKGLAENSITPMFKLDTSTNYIAFSRITQPQLVEQFRQALIKVKKSAEYAKLIKKWQEKFR